MLLFRTDFRLFCNCIELSRCRSGTKNQQRGAKNDVVHFFSMIGLTILLRVFKAVPTANISFYLNNTKMHNINHSERLPYEKLAALGIDREKADSLPQEVKEKLASGEVTPLMQVSISARSGDIITLPLKLQLTTDQQGNPALMAYPVRAVLEKERNQVLRLTEQEAERLNKGEVIQKAVEVNGEKTQQYLQLDPETKSIFHCRVTDVQLEQKLKDMEKVNDIELGMQQKQQVREGKPIELNVGGEKVSVGVDLKEPQGFKVIQGDMKEWERQQKLRYDEQHPEYLGLVMMDKNRWEYQQVVDKQSQERALKLHAPKAEQSKGLKL